LNASLELNLKTLIFISINQCLKFASLYIIIQFKQIKKLDAKISQVFLLDVYVQPAGPTTTNNTATTTLQR